jgi:integrase
VVRVVGTLVELNGGKLFDDTPKSRTGRRVVAIPSQIIPDLRAHLARYAEPGEWGHVFIGPKGGLLRRSAFRRIWNRVQADAVLLDLHFHDLRHADNTLAATTGASLRELMTRMGHSSTRAALIYQHATQERDQAITQTLGKAIGHATGTTPKTAPLKIKSPGQ